MRNKYAKVSEPNEFVTNPGSKIHIEYSPIVFDDGSIVLKESGYTDIEEKINSYVSQTDMTYILGRMAAGDTSVLNQKEPMYGDFTVMPKTYAEALQLVIDRERQFMELPIDVRNKFDNDFRKWFAQSGSKDWFEKMESVIPKEKEIVENSSDAKEEIIE